MGVVYNGRRPSGWGRGTSGPSHAPQSRFEYIRYIILYRVDCDLGTPQHFPWPCSPPTHSPDKGGRRAAHPDCGVERVVTAGRVEPRRALPWRRTESTGPTAKLNDGANTPVPLGCEVARQPISTNRAEVMGQVLRATHKTKSRKIRTLPNSTFRWKHVARHTPPPSATAQ